MNSVRPLRFLLLTSLLSACGDPYDSSSFLHGADVSSAAQGERPATTRLVVYRGQRVLAEVQGDRLVIEGDIVITEDDLDDVPADGSIPKGNAGFNAAKDIRWPDGVIYYRFGSMLGANQCKDSSGTPIVCSTVHTQEEWEDIVRRAMRDWADATFVEFVEDEDLIQSDYIEISGIPSGSGCSSSSIGRNGGQQTIALANGCLIGNEKFKTHHELGHAMGLVHEHQRTDRNDWLIVDSSRLQASDPDDVNNWFMKGRILGSYDCESVMHYGEPNTNDPPGLRVKVDSSGNPLCPVEPGQRNHLSAGDVAAVNALYPQLLTHDFFFANTGTQRICHLQGREADANTHFEHAVVGTPSMGGESPYLHTGAFPEGDYSMECRFRSCFWTADYAYPASTVAKPWYLCGSLGEHEMDGDRVRVANPGLIAVLF